MRKIRTVSAFSAPWNHKVWEYYIKNQVDFVIKCQKVLAICAKLIYNGDAICVIRICAMF